MRTLETTNATTTELTGLELLAADSLRIAPNFAEKTGYISGLAKAWGVKLNAARIIAAVNENPAMERIQISAQIESALIQ